MFRLLGLGAMVAVGIGAYKFFKKKQTSTQSPVQEETQPCEQESGVC